MRPTIQGLLVLVLFAAAGAVATAELPKDRADAPDVVTGTVRKLDVSEDKYDDGRVVTSYTALVKVETVEKTTRDNNRIIKPDDTITVRWGQVIRTSGSVGYSYDVKEKAAIRAYLFPRCGGDGYVTIDNRYAIEKIDGAGK
jgi:hypothetical protein